MDTITEHVQLGEDMTINRLCWYRPIVNWLNN